MCLLEHFGISALNSEALLLGQNFQKQPLQNAGSEKLVHTTQALRKLPHTGLRLSMWVLLTKLSNNGAAS